MPPDPTQLALAASIVSLAKRVPMVWQAVAVILIAVGGGWTAHAWLSEQFGTPARVSALEEWRVSMEERQAVNQMEHTDFIERFDQTRIERASIAYDINELRGEMRYSLCLLEHQSGSRSLESCDRWRPTTQLPH